jgi:translation initiation factor IF-2
MADKEGVSVHSAPVIFSLMDWLRGVIEKHLPPKEEVETLGTAVVKQVFPFKIGKGKFYNVAGCFVEKGSITRGDTVQIFRKNDLLYEGPIHSIRHFKDNVKTVRTGQECGISFGKTFTLDIQPDDVIVAIKRKQIHRTLEEQQAPDIESEETA